MENRQSGASKSVDQSAEQDRSAAARAHIASQVASRMRELGWDGDAGVRKLRDEVARHHFGDRGAQRPRWQTVQEWMQGKTLPSTKYQTSLARALGVTLEQLAGLALGHEPRSTGWRTFVDSSLGESMSAEERAILAGHRPPASLRDGYSEGYYRSALLNLRSETA